jgi:glucuronate isomerase
MAVLNRAKADAITTTEFALDGLEHHKVLAVDGKFPAIGQA